jgi:TolB-like protein/class 3 adenylate cyclase
MERRLAAVLIADVAGYVRLSQADEEGTRARFQADLHEIFEPAIAAHHGRLVKTMGDAYLVEFHSVVDAVRCAVEVQRHKALPNAIASEAKRLAYRIGINLGDIIVEGDDIHGDGVNIADRLQELADPGGIVVSGSAYDHLKSNIDVGYASLGEHHVKHVARPVRVYRVLLDSAAAGKTIATAHSRRTVWHWAAAATAFFVVIAAAILAWQRPWKSQIEAAAIERMALPLPDKPSIVVLPFANMSDDPKQDYFADGITDDLITELSKVSGLFVISRNTSFSYRGMSVQIGQVAEELGVCYVLEGSVQRSGDRVRINAQLIDALSGGHVWADRFDGSVADIFPLQDKVATSTADALAVRLTARQRVSVLQKETSVPAAYEAFLRGWEHFRRTTPQEYAEAVPYLEEAIMLDPAYSRAHAALALVYMSAYEFWWHESLGLTLTEVMKKAQQHLAEAEKQPTSTSYQVAGKISRATRYSERAISEFGAAIALDPSDSWNYALLAETLNFIGRPAEAVPNIQTAMRLDPHYPADFLRILGMAQFGLERFEDAAASLSKASEMNPEDQSALAILVASYGYLGRKDDAARAIVEYNAAATRLGRLPLSIWDNAACGHAEVLPISVSVAADRKRLTKGLHLAGVPGWTTAETLGAENRLKGPEVRSLLFGHELRGHDYGCLLDADRLASVTADGIATLSGNWGNWRDTRTAIEGDRLCIKSEIDSHCFAAFRYPGGTKEKLNEYILFSGRGAFMFSQVK